MGRNGVFRAAKRVLFKNMHENHGFLQGFRALGVPREFSGCLGRHRESKSFFFFLFLCPMTLGGPFWTPTLWHSFERERDFQKRCFETIVFFRVR